MKEYSQNSKKIRLDYRNQGRYTLIEYTDLKIFISTLVCLFIWRYPKWDGILLYLGVVEKSMYIYVYIAE